MGACAKPRAVRFCKSLWARSVRPQGRQRPHPWRTSGSALGIAQGGTVDPDGVALMAQATEEGLDERFVAEKRLPFRVIEVECRAYCYAELTDEARANLQFLPKDQSIL